MVGGGMRQAGVLAAAGLIALEKGPKRLHIDHENAKFLARELAPMPGIRLNPAKVQTNIVILDVRETGLSSNDFLAGLANKGVLGVPIDQEKVRMVTTDVDRKDVETAARKIGELRRNSLAAHESAAPGRSGRTASG